MMKNIVLLIGLTLVLTSCGDKMALLGKANSKDWPLFRGDASLSGYTDIRLPENPALLWEYKSSKRTVSSPVVLDGTTYWCDRFGFIRGVNVEGELVFEYNLNTSVEATPMIHDSTLYIGRIDGYMTAISLSKQDTLWNYETWGQISASPNTFSFDDTKALVFGSYDNYLYCLNMENGEELSRFESGYYLNGAAALWNGHVIFGGCDSWVRIIDCKTGIQTDSLLLEAYVPASPAIWGDHCYIGDYSGAIHQIVLKDGKFVRHKRLIAPIDDNSSFVSVPAISKKAIYFLSNDKYLNAINPKSEALMWRYLLKGNVGESSPVVCNDKVIVCTKTGIVSILDALDGTLLWEYDTGEQIVGSPAIVNNHFFILTSRGTLLCFGEH